MDHHVILRYHRHNGERIDNLLSSMSVHSGDISTVGLSKVTRDVAATMAIANVERVLLIPGSPTFLIQVAAVLARVPLAPLKVKSRSGCASGIALLPRSTESLA